MVIRLAATAHNRMLGSFYNYLFGARSAASPKTHPYSTDNVALPADAAASFHPRLTTIFQQLDAIAPRFTTKGSNIDILTSPQDFYETLKHKILHASNHVFLSSLYVGKGQVELVETLAEALAKNVELKVFILTDALRGTREAPNNPSSASLLVTLVEKFGKHRVDIRMYHTPHLSGFKKNLAPKRVNESFGLQHMKLYGFDNEVMLSGANLSHDYFTDRQDRYYLFKDAAITDYYFKIHKAVSSLSYQLLPSTKPHKYQTFRLSWPTSNRSCEPDMNFQRFISDSSYLLEPLLKQHQLSAFEQYSDTNEFDTIVYPVSQFTPLFPAQNDASTEKPAVLRLLSYLDSSKIKWWFTAGYFNMLPQIQDRLCNGKAEGTVITASAKANSFYKSPGVSYYIPEAYLLIAKKFLEELRRRGKESLIKLYEWQNGVVNTPGGWTYHAKGLWITVPEEEEPSITVVGSSNFTKRAYSCDLESNAIIVTKNQDLKHRMRSEIDNLMTYAHPLELEDFDPKLKQTEEKQEDRIDAQGNPVTPEEIYEIGEDRKISYGVHLALKFFGGKL
ncbi:uncharacterized protein CXQ87_002681 [Candidozyma duobushaemuli]|uniref:CDP-diacylglycerol--glycerol-3-phosphate 3-phosphatidyltransferase n=2 Tax=Candidozyma TaxID=3303203 RepID=A0ABX8I235_9ASCO|nr:uncharacterized protein CXQ87_002681 [[Candida] duobushaemulonis]PVH14540.1 hypothetical protein CXQ87_002681 [[Candida] duobushaemulonis]QWU87301.1 hypothetical protein CA3LBN_001566 [[Candida] haemuloni]